MTPLVSEDGAKKPAFRRVIPVIRRLQEEGFWIDLFEVKVVGPTEPVGEAKFVHLWQYKNGAWKITRVISYDHHALPK